MKLQVQYKEIMELKYINYTKYYKELITNPIQDDKKQLIQSFIELQKNSNIEKFDIAKVIIKLYQTYKFNKPEIIVPYFKELGIKRNLRFFVDLDEIKKTIDKINEGNLIYISPAIIQHIDHYLNSKILNEILESMQLTTNTIRNSKANRSNYNIFSAEFINMNRSKGTKNITKQLKLYYTILKQNSGYKNFQKDVDKLMKGDPNKSESISTMFTFPNLIILKKPKHKNHITRELAKLINLFDPTMLYTEEEFNFDGGGYLTYNIYLYDKITSYFKINMTREINRSLFTSPQ